MMRMPELFPVLRGLVDERRRAGEKSGQFLLLGSASPELLRQSPETLAGRISYLELCPLQLLELPEPDGALPQHWERGGYPESFLAADAETSLQWREDFMNSYVERYLPQQGITATPMVLRRFCSMLAHQQGATINLSKVAGSLGIDGKTARRYLDLLEQPDGQILAVEIKRTLSPKVTPGLIESMDTLGSQKGFIVIPEGEPYPLSKTVTAIGLRPFLESIS